MEFRKEHFWLIVIFLAVLGFRLYFTLQTQHFDYDAYFNIRQVDSIRNTGVPLFTDDLSFGGRTTFFLPLYYYILALFTFFTPVLMVLKVIPNIFASCLVFIVFFISLEITKNKNAAIFAAFVSGFIPIFIYKTFNSVSIYSISIPLLFFLLFCLLKIQDKRFIPLYVLGLFALTFIHATSLLLVLGLAFYVVFALLENLEYSRSEIELTIFSLLFVVWLSLLIFKNPLLFHGPAVVWQNTPNMILDESFSRPDFVDAVYKIGVVPFIFGIYVIYRYIFRERRKAIYLFMSFAMAVLLMLFLRLIQFDIGLMFLGIILSILFSQFYKLFFIYLDKTRLSRLKILAVLGFFLVFIASSVLPSALSAQRAISEAPSHRDIRALDWLEKNTPENSIVLATPQEGYVINAVANRKNVVDQNFLLVRDINQRFVDVNRTFTTFSEIEAIRLLNKYDVDYIMFSREARSYYKTNALSYVDDKNCFEIVYTFPPIYRSICRIEEI